MDDARLQAYEPAPGAHAYTAFHGLARPLRFGGRGGRRLPGELRRVGCQLRPHEPRASRPLRAHREDRAGRALEGARGDAALGFLGNTDDRTAFAMNLNVERFLNRSFSVGP